MIGDSGHGWLRTRLLILRICFCVENFFAEPKATRKMLEVGCSYLFLGFVQIQE